MSVRELSQEECFQWIGGVRLARLACANANQPYITPVYLVFQKSSSGSAFYGFTTQGLKTDWMRANPLVCVEMDEVQTRDHWTSLIAFGYYEELPEPSNEKNPRLPSRAESSNESGSEENVDPWDEHLLAHRLLQTHAQWWEPASTVRIHAASETPFVPVFYKIRIDSITGYSATPQIG
jgi:uncharacterized protein